MQDTLERIPIVLCTDERNVLPMSVVITSLLENARDRARYDFYILLKNYLTADHKARFLSYEEQYKGCSITLMVVDQRALKGAVLKQYFGMANYYRLLIPELLPELHKCLYLDTDVVVTRDLSDLYDLDLSGCYVAGVRNGGFRSTEAMERQRARMLRIPDMKQYINNGVMVINIDELRKDNVQETMVALTRRGFDAPCQDVTNAACYGKTKLLPLKYNIPTKYFELGEEGFFARRTCRVGFTVDEYRDAQRDPAVIHFVNRSRKGPVKPWTTSGLPFADQWWKYARLSPLWDDIKRSYGHLERSATAREARASTAATSNSSSRVNAPRRARALYEVDAASTAGAASAINITSIDSAADTIHTTNTTTTTDTETSPSITTNEPSTPTAPSTTRTFAESRAARIANARRRAAEAASAASAANPDFLKPRPPHTANPRRANPR